MTEPSPRETSRVHPVVDRLAAYSWRLIVIGIVAWAVLHVLGLLRVIVFAVVAAVLLTVVLAAPARWLREHRVRPLAAAWLVVLGFLGLLALAGWVIVPPVASEFGELGPTVTEAADDVERWLIEDSPFDLDRRRLEELKEQATERAREAITSSGGVVLRSAILLFEVVAGILLALVMTFFFVKDGERFQQWALRQLPEHRHALARRMAARAWRTLGGYLRGSATLGLLEGIIIGVAMAVVGADLVLPVMVLTFMAAFVPFVGAIVAGVVAVAVTLVTAGGVPALVVAGVALAVQQLDNDLLAPVVFGKALELHPLVILLSVTAGATLAGLAGAFLAVPTAAVIINVTAEARAGD